MEKEIIKAVRDHVGAVASLKSAIEVTKLPKTRSGKIARHTISCMIHRKPYVVRYRPIPPSYVSLLDVEYILYLIRTIISFKNFILFKINY